ncbi:cbp/p300-interacting transactivator 4b [Narcine bancroftii]|uniref:cbp/p300-interacting transactivator 4b n=1 Tax=Narcine bancroftii TaxID=1343680 RepID=UPI0038321DD1
MAEHIMMSVNPGRFPDGTNGLQNYRMGINGLQTPQHVQAGLRRDHPGTPLLHYGGASMDNSGGMRSRPGLGNMTGQLNHHQMPANVMYSSQQQQFLDSLSPQQLMATVHLQKLNNQYHSHPLMGINNGMAPNSQPYRSALNQSQLPGIQHAAPPSLSLNVMDTDLIDEDVLTSLVLELGLDRIQELPELWLGQNEFDFISDFVNKQQPSTVSC